MPLLKRKRKYPTVKRTKTDKRTGRKIVVSERPSVREQIERWPRIRTHEMVWGKDIGGELVPVAREENRERRSVKVDEEKAKKFGSVVHNHQFRLYHLLRRRGKAYPTIHDLRRLVERFKVGKTTSETVASLSFSGKVQGYTVVSLKGVEKPKEQIEKEFNRFLGTEKGLFTRFELTPKGIAVVYISPFSSVELMHAYVEGLEEIGFRFKHVAMPDYRFDKRKGRFVKKRRKKKKKK